MTEETPYIVLARKYRPRDFTQLIGQEGLVTTINNSIKHNKVAHSFLLSGIRGIGKTTTARIIAKTLNCEDVQLNGDIYVACGKCNNCKACEDQSHPDIIELDAASKTGVNDIREVIDNTRYTAVMGKYKIYVIDEVHMLSTSAFNALLKTLEEPPAHLKFIFATTEPRKIPLTIISRCQKYDLRRFSIDDLKLLLTNVCNQEGVKIKDDALNAIAIYAQGSARDALSLLDMIIINSQEEITQEFVEKTLGVTNKTGLYDLFSALLKGDAEYSLNKLTQFFHEGIEAIYLLEDLLDICTNCAKVKSHANCIDNLQVTSFEKEAIKKIAQEADIPRLSRIWQMLFKGLGELKYSEMPIQTTEMIFIRICYLADKPTPAEIVTQIKKNSNASVTESIPTDKNEDVFAQWSKMVELFKQHKEMILYYHLKQDIALKSIKDNCIEVSLLHHVEPSIIKDIKNKLAKFTGKRWEFRVSKSDADDVTLAEKELEDIKNNEIIRLIFDNFTSAKIDNIKTKQTN